jgi:hypothetical protein
MNKKKLFDEIINSIKTIDIMDQVQGYEFYDKVDRLLDDFGRRAHKISQQDKEIYLKEINEIQENFNQFREEFNKSVNNLNDEQEVFRFMKLVGSSRFKYGESFSDGIFDQKRIIDIAGSLFMNAGLLGKLNRIIIDTTPLPQLQPLPQQKPKADHSELFKALSKHVTGISAGEFTNIIENHKLTGTKKAKWIGSEKSQARYFADNFHFTIKEFNSCFVFEDCKKLPKGIRPTTKKPFKDLLKPFLK